MKFKDMIPLLKFMNKSTNTKMLFTLIYEVKCSWKLNNASNKSEETKDFIMNYRT